MAVVPSTGCRTPEPVGKLEVQPTQLELPYPCSVPLLLTWQPAVPLEGLRGKPRVFVHLLDQAGTLVRTFDHPYPDHWRAESPQRYEIDILQSALGEPLATGTYQLTAGLYDSDGGERWLLESGPEVGHEEYRVATVVVPDASPEVAVSFTGAWLPPEAGTDLQVLGRRWADGPATISLTKEPGAGMLHLGLDTPSWVNELAEEAVIALSTTCGEQTASSSGSGPSEIGLGIGADVQECEVILSPSFELTEAADSPGLFVLDKLTWAP